METNFNIDCPFPPSSLLFCQVWKFCTWVDTSKQESSSLRQFLFILLHVQRINKHAFFSEGKVSPCCRRTSCSLDIEQRWFELDLTWKLPPGGLVVLVPEKHPGSFQKKEAITLPSCNTSEPQLVWYNAPTDEEIACIHGQQPIAL